MLILCLYAKGVFIIQFFKKDVFAIYFIGWWICFFSTGYDRREMGVGIPQLFCIISEMGPNCFFSKLALLYMGLKIVVIDGAKD